MGKCESQPDQIHNIYSASDNSVFQYNSDLNVVSTVYNWLDSGEVQQIIIMLIYICWTTWY